MIMIRDVSLRDAKAIVDIYNEYIVNSVITFETEPLREEEMRGAYGRHLGKLSLFSVSGRRRGGGLLLCPRMEREGGL